MDQLTAEVAPAFNLVNWAAMQPAMKNVWDRPWYQALTPPPVQTVAIYGAAYPTTWHYRCHCKANTRVQRYPCEDGEGFLYLGQCNRCQAVIWAYKKIGQA